MKIFLFFLAFLLGLESNAQQNILSKKNHLTMENKQDYNAINKALNDYYFTGIYEGDTALLNKIYNKGTLLFGDVNGVPYAKTLDEYLTGVQNRESPKKSNKPFKTEIISIRIINSIAIAEVKVKMYDFNYHELLSFHKIDEEWLIVNKMISNIPE